MSDQLPISRRTAFQIAATTVAAATVVSPKRAEAARPRVVLPNDRRLGELTDYNGYFPWQPYTKLDEWQRRAEYVRRQVLVSTGLWPMPTKRPLNPVVHGLVERDDYTVEKVILQTGEGLYCTGSLYRPKSPASGKRAGVLCPHGHWPNGRFHKHNDDLFAKELETKAEKFPEAGRHPLQARSVQLARMGCVVFLYDMLGYADSAPLSQALVHGFAKQRDDLSSPEHWGLFSAQSELRCLNGMGLQTWNSVRALDWFSSLEDVDPNRIGVTGASGGGTQTFILGCIDDRPAAFFPAVMVSTAMQGGCTCENASYLRVGTGNIEFAAMIGPRPLAMSAADDWTVALETKGLPELKQHYAMLGVPDLVTGKYFPYPHNYNQHARAMMYDFFNQYLKLGVEGPIVERDFVPLSIEEASVWNANYPKPEATVDAELKIVNGFAKDQQAQFASLAPKDAASLDEYRRVVGGAWDVIIGRKLPGKDDFTQQNTFKSDGEGLMRFNTLVRIGKAGEEVPTLFYLPKNWNKQVAIWIADDGKDSLLTEKGDPIPAVQKLIDAGVSVALPDLLFQGEFLSDGQPLTKTRKVVNPREFVGYTTGYNHPLFSQRVHDVLTLVAFCRFSKYEPSTVSLIGLGKQSGAIAAAAAFQAGTAVDKVAIGTNGFRFASITNARDPMLLPGAVKYGDLPGVLALLAPRPLWMADEAAIPGLVTAAYQSAGAAGNVSLGRAAEANAAEAAATWVIG